MRRNSMPSPSRFLSTPSARRATLRPAPQPAYRSHFYPRPPRGGRLFDDDIARLGVGISIHALREEGDGPSRSFLPGCRYFYPRPPRGGRPGVVGQLNKLNENFYPRPPRGGRPVLVAFYGSTQEFLSTPSARRATRARGVLRLNAGISIHALREEGDLSFRWPCIRREVISIHALREEGDLISAVRLRMVVYFYPRPPRGGRRPDPAAWGAGIAISIHALREEGDPTRSVATLPK